MSATPFLSSPILSKNSCLTYTSNPIWDSNGLSSHFLNLFSLKNPNPKFTTCSIQGKNDSVKSADPDYPTAKEPILRSGSSCRNRTAPWMKGSPLILEPNQVSDITGPRNRKGSSKGRDEKAVASLAHKVSEARGRKAMKVIFQGIHKLQETHKMEETKKSIDHTEFQFSLGKSDEVKVSKIRAKKPRESDEKVTEFQFSMRESDEAKVSNFRGKMPWESDEKVVFRKMKKEKVKTEAELRIDGLLLERLRGEAAKMRNWVKVMKAGVTDAVIDRMHSAWSDNELVMLKFDLPLSKNMDRAKEIVETKTGGIVVWTRKDVHVVYRGCNYQPGFETFTNEDPHIGGGEETSHSYGVKLVNFPKKSNETASSIAEMVGRKDEVPINGSLFEREADRLLDELGPRFVDWWMAKPLPVDADLLPEVVRGFKPPPRLCPPHARSKISNDDLTYLRKLARPLPTHFVLGRNRKLQGLAAAIIKLWEKCHIAKIAVKWGVPNTDNEQMANELKSLTGGVLLLRNKFYIILYRGKDFLSREVASMVADREVELNDLQTQEESSRAKPIDTVYLIDESSSNTSTVGTLSEFHDILSECGGLDEGKREDELKLEAEKARVEKELQNQERKLHILKVKIGIASKELTKLNSSWSPTEQDVDQEILTEEERACFWKIGLKMDKTVVLGRRGVFDGVIESIHQHWKHREIVKVITMQRILSRITYTAKLLEAETGGVLISVDKMEEGHAIILFRGRNYRRPEKRLPQNLLTKSEALQRSIAMQRVGSLKFFAHQRQKEVANLKSKLAELQKGVIE